MTDVVVGRDIPFRKKWMDLSRKYAGYGETVVFKRIESGMEVIPIIAGDRAHIDITPRISHEVTEGKKEIIRFAGALTKVSVPLGQWITIGGADDERSEAFRAILESGTETRGRSLSISFMVEAN